MIQINESGSPTPQFRVLKDEQCNEIYLATLKCLSRVGVIVDYPPALDLLASSGARIEGNRAYIPADIIQNALGSAPRTFTIWGRDQRHDLQITPGRVHFGPGPTCTYFYDPITGERRKAGRGDAGLTARVCDYLDQIDYIMSLSLYDDVTPVLSPVYEFADMVTNTVKPIIAWANDPATLADIYNIAIEVAGSEESLRKKPLFALFACYESPLRHPKNPIANMLWAAEHDIPVIYLGGPTVGLESPATSASALVIYLAAVLSGLAIVQLKRCGAPVVLGGLPSPMDLRTARPAYGSPEMSLHSAAAAELAHFLGLPFMSTAGASDSKVLDSQAALETSLQILLSALSGASLVHDVGFLDCADIGSLELLVVTDEIIAMVKRIMRGVEVSTKTLNLDLIEKVGPGGNFLSEVKSAMLCKSEIWIPTLMDRNAYAIWEKEGSLRMEDRVKKKLIKILDTHQPPALPAGVNEKIDNILAEAEKRYQ
jgi:trimethylamine--corrinoid protein Co-methyltransferase